MYLVDRSYFGVVPLKKLMKRHLALADSLSVLEKTPIPLCLRKKKIVLVRFTGTSQNPCEGTQNLVYINFYLKELLAMIRLTEDHSV